MQPPDSSDWYVVEQQGRILIVRNGTVVPNAFLDVQAAMGDNLGERGLLSVAFHPQYATNGRFFTMGTPGSLSDGSYAPVSADAIVEWRRDPMNADRRLLRAAIRHEVLPSIERAVGRDVKRTIARTADTLRADRDELDRQTALAASDVVEVAGAAEGGTEVRFAVAELLALPPALALRVIRLGVAGARSSADPAPWTKEAIEAVLDLANGRPGRRRDLPNGSTAVRDRRYVRVSFAPPPLGLPPKGDPRTDPRGGREP
jgi:hypothetical protein